MFKVGDIVSGYLSKDPNKICQGNQMFNLGGKKIIGCVGYSNFYKEYYVTTDGITYASIPKKWITRLKKIATWNATNYKGFKQLIEQH